MIKLNSTCTICKSHNCFIKKYCSDEWIKIIEKKKYQTFYKQNQNIINEGTRVSGIYFIQHGKVKVVSTSKTGKQQIVRFANDGHVLGHRGSENDVYPISAAAMEDSIICFVENELLYEMFMANPKITFAMMMFYSQELRKAESRLKNIALMNIGEKIADALLMLHESFGLNKKKQLNVPFSRNDIASIVGTNSSQVTRQLAEFEKEGLIAKEKRHITILNLKGLKEIISEYKQLSFSE